MESELKSLAKVSLLTALSATYARFIAQQTKPGALRLALLLPILCLLPSLPWFFSSITLRGLAAFFLAWLALFKLLLLSFTNSHLSPSTPLLQFIACIALPIKLKPQTSNPTPPHTSTLISTCVKIASLAAIIYLHLHSKNSSYSSPSYLYLDLVLQCLYIYLVLDLYLAAFAAAVRLLGGVELEPQFDAPLKSSSHREFWGRRWNLNVTAVLRPTVYEPVRRHSGRSAGVVAAFLVSGVMHEALFYYINLERPTGKGVAFFVLNGVSVVVEAAAARAGWRGPRVKVVGVVLTLGYVAATAAWLFFPAFLSGGLMEKIEVETREVLEFFGRLESTCRSWL